MLDKVFYTYIVDKFNNQHSQDIHNFKGNYVYIQTNQSVTLQEVSSYNAYDVSDVQFYPIAEVISKETAFADENNRSEWTKQFAIYFPLSDKDGVLSALQEVRDWFLAQDTHSITDGSDTYKWTIKMQRPEFAGVTEPKAGKRFATYVMTIGASSVETGYYGNEATVQIKEYGGTYVTPIIENLVVNSKCSTDPDNDITTSTNTNNDILARGVTLLMDVYYDGTDILKLLYKQVIGKQDREQKYVINVNFDGYDAPYTCKVLSGGVEMKKGIIIKLNITFGEVA